MCRICCSLRKSQVSLGRSVVHGNFAIASGCSLNEVENHSIPTDCHFVGAFCATCVSSTPFRERGESNFGSERSLGNFLTVQER
jgi:hypothetical protein